MYTVSVATTPQNRPSSGVSDTFQSVGIVTSLLVSSCILVGTVYSIISRINRIVSSIEQIEKRLEEQKKEAEKLDKLEREYYLHVQEYINRKDVIQMLLGQLNEKIDHKFRRALFYSRDIQKYLQAKTDFKVREYEETTRGSDE